MGQIETNKQEILLTQARLQWQQAEVLRKIGKRLSAVLDFDELLDLLLDQLALIMPDDSVDIIFTVDDTSRVVRQRRWPLFNIICHDLTDPAVPTFLIAETRNLQHIVTTGESLIIPNVKEYEGWVETVYFPDEFHAWAGVPLFINNRVQAVLAVYSRQIDAYREEDMERFSFFARQAELAIQNAMLYQSTMRRLDELTALQELTALAALAVDEDELISEATDVLQKIIYTDNFGVLMANTSQTRLVVHSSYHLGEHNRDFSSISVDRGIVGYVFRTGEVVRIGDVSQHPHYVQAEDYTHSELCVPMKAAGQVLGVINAESNSKNAYSTDDERLVATIADQIATAVTKIRLLDREKQRQQETETLRLAGNALVASLSLEDVLENIMIELGKLIHFDSAGVLLLDGEYLRVAAGRGFSPEIEKALIGKKFPLDQSLAFNLAEQPSPMLIDDVRNEPRFHFWGGTNYIRGWLAAPLAARGEIIGFLTADSRQVGAYRERDKQIIQAFANQAAIAIENARLFEAERKARETAVILREASIKLSESRDMDTVLGQLLDSLAELVVYDSANVMLLENNKLMHKSLRGYENWTDPQLLWDIYFDIEQNNGFFTIFKRGKPYVIDDTALAPDWEETATNGYIRSWLGVPLYAGGDVIGCISLDKNETHFFTQSDIDLVESFAAQTAVIIQNILYFNEMEKVGMLLRVLNATPRVIDALPTLASHIKSTANCEFASISIFDDPQHRYYTYYAATGDGDHPVDIQRLLVRDTMVANRLLQAEIIYMPDLSTSISYAVERERYKTGMRSRIILPLVAGPNVIGTLNLSWATVNGYDAGKISLFKRIADAIALAVERSDLYDQSRRQATELETLFSVSTAMRLAGSVPDILNALIQHVETVIHPLFISVMLAEEPTGDLVAYSHVDVELSDRRRRIPKGKGICGHVYATGEVYTTVKLADDPLMHVLPEEHIYLARLGGSITLPLQTLERTIGVVHIGLQSEHLLSEAETRLLTGIAEIAGSALDRALVMETLEQHVDERTHELTIANQRLTELDRLKSKFVSDVSHELRTPITNLGLYVQLMQRGNAEKQAYYLDVLHTQSERLKNLVEDILSLSRLERAKGKMELTAVNINNIITQVAQSGRVQSKTGELTLTTVLHPDLPLALSDNDQFLQVISNLIINALNYTKEGSVEISTTIDDESDMICLTVADSGKGITDQDMPYIFDRFYRGHEVGSSAIPGTGLGLSIVQEIVLIHNGRLEIESTVGEGTTIRIWLQKAP